MDVSVHVPLRWLCDPGKLYGFPAPQFPCLQQREGEQPIVHAGEEFIIIRALNPQLFLLSPNWNQI